MSVSDETPEVVAFQRAYVDLLDGDVMAALLLSQVFYWYQPAKNGGSKLRVFKFGKWWLAKSNVDWRRELGFTPKQSRRAMQVLIDRGILEAEVMKFDGAPVTHCRLAAVDGRQTLIDPMGVFHFSFGSFPFSLEGKSLTENTTETTAEDFKQAPDKSDATAEDETMNIQQAMEKVKNQKPKTKPTATSLGLLWKKRISNLTGGGFVKDLTGKELGQLKLLLKSVGDQAPDVTDWALQNWADFTWEVRHKKGLSVAPEVPQIGFLLQHHDVAMQLIAKPAVKTASPPKLDTAPSPAKLKAVPKVGGNEPKAGTADVAETLALLEQFSGS